MRSRQVVVIGSSDETRYHGEAVRIGRFVAESGHVLVSGGRGGVMESASQGAFEAGGTVIGILPGEDLGGANRYCTIVIPTGMGFARNVINVFSGDLIIAIGGGAGTLTEISYAWIYCKPVICCTFAEGWSREMASVRIDDRQGGILLFADSVEDVFRHVESLLGPPNPA